MQVLYLQIFKKIKSQLEFAILKTEGQLNHLYAISILHTEAE